jgi:hypothetical protein
MSVTIGKKIVGYEIVGKSNETKVAANPPAVRTPATSGQPNNIVQMQPLLQRPQELPGVTYKVKHPMSEHALYVTINDILVNEGTEHEHRRPFEIFINSKNMENFAWIVALTRVLSAVFRQGGDLSFLAEELRSVFDPRGGYWKSGGRYVPSIVAEIGECIETHLKFIGMLREKELPGHVQEKRQQMMANAETVGMPGAKQCPKCNQPALVKLEGCDTCLECGYSHCS